MRPQVTQPAAAGSEGGNEGTRNRGTDAGADPPAVPRDHPWLGLQGSEWWRAAAHEPSTRTEDGTGAPASGGTRAAAPGGQAPCERGTAYGARPTDASWRTGGGGWLPGDAHRKSWRPRRGFGGCGALRSGVGPRGAPWGNGGGPVDRRGTVAAGVRRRGSPTASVAG
eukprot:4803285-Pleurochrysis_carterae.AAC.1